MTNNELEVHLIAHEAFGTLANFAATNANCPQYIRELAADYERQMKEAKALRDADYRLATPA